MKPSEVLRAARAKIEKAENWTQGAYARDAAGSFVYVGETEAHSFCSLGACRTVVFDKHGDRDEDVYERAKWALKRELLRDGDQEIADFNDTHSHVEVLALFDRAIAAAEARGE